MPEKLRSDSLEPGTSVLSLVKSSFIFCNDERCIPLLTSDEKYCIGYVRVDNIPYFRASKHFSYTKKDKVRILKCRMPDLQRLLDSFTDELLKRKVIKNTTTDCLKIFPERGGSIIPLANVESSIVELMGAKTGRVVIIGYQGYGRNCKIWMGRRVITAVKNPAKLQLLLSLDNESSIMRREELAKVAYKAIGLQPDLYNKLHSAGVMTIMRKTSQGIARTSIHNYELDLSESSGGGTLFCPKASQETAIQSYELIPIKTVIDWCQAELVNDQDVPAILSFCVRHGIINVETEENYEVINQALNYDISSPFPYKK